MINPKRTLAVITGASEWPLLPQFEPAAAFANSANALHDYLRDTDGLGLAKSNVLWLFERDRVDEQYERIDTFLQSRLLRMNAPQGEEVVVLFAYVGHGAFFGENSEYCLLTRGTRRPIEAATSFRLADLARLLRMVAPMSSRILILDCCFAGKAAASFQSDVEQVVGVKAREVVDTDRGVALLCAASARNPAKLAGTSSFTMFGNELVRVLRSGDEETDGPLTLRQVCTLVRGRLTNEYDDAPRPEVHVPDQRGGDLAEQPLFPNRARPRVPASSAIPDLTLQILDGGAPADWRASISIDVEVGTDMREGLRPDTNGIVAISGVEPGLLLARIRKGIGENRRVARAPLRSLLKVPSEIVIDLAVLPRDAWTLDDIAAGKKHVKLNRLAPGSHDVSDDSRGHAPWGLPSASMLIQRKAYTAGIEPGWRIPRWVAHRVHPGLPPHGRPEFQPDPAIAAADRIGSHVYRGSGFDRGNLVSCHCVGGLGQRAATDAMRMSVVAPQHPDVNRRMWLKVEEYSRALAGRCDVVALSGPVFNVDAGGFHVTTFGEPAVMVPEGFFRVLSYVGPGDASVEPDPLVFLIPNEAVPFQFKLEEFRSTVAQVESLTGLQLFPLCQPATVNRLRQAGMRDLWHVGVE